MTPEQARAKLPALVRDPFLLDDPLSGEERIGTPDVDARIRARAVQ